MCVCVCFLRRAWSESTTAGLDGRRFPHRSQISSDSDSIDEGSLLFICKCIEMRVYRLVSLSDADSEFGWSEDEISDLHDNTTVIIAADGEPSPSLSCTSGLYLLESEL